MEEQKVWHQDQYCHKVFSFFKYFDKNFSPASLTDGYRQSARKSETVAPKRDRPYEGHALLLMLQKHSIFIKLFFNKLE